MNMIRATGAVTVFLMAAMMLCACQPTPDSGVIVNKGDGSLSSMAAATPSTKQLRDVPLEEKRTFSSEDDMIMVDIDASVSVPDTDKIPVATITPRGLTQSEIDSIMDTLMQGKPLYEPRGPEDYTKDELMEIILKLKSGNDSDLYHMDPDAYFREKQPEIDEYQALYEKAPEERTKKPSDTTLKTNDSGVIGVGVTADFGKTEPAYFSYIEHDMNYITFQFQNNENNPIGGAVTENFDVPGVTMPVDQAQRIAEEAVSNFGMGDFTLNGAGTTPNASVEDMSASSSYEDLPKCYIFFFTRQIEGINETYVNREYIPLAPSEQFNFVWPVEEIEVLVDDSGIVAVLYTGPAADIEVTNDNVQIKPYEDILDIFEKQIKNEGAYPKEDDIIQTKVNINKITLGGMKILDKDHPGQFIFVPVWDFFGLVTSRYKPGMGGPGSAG